MLFTEQNPRALAAVSAAIQQYAEDTCIRFKPRKNEKDYLEFFVGRGCWSYIGRIRGKQQVKYKLQLSEVLLFYLTKRSCLQSLQREIIILNKSYDNLSLMM